MESIATQLPGSTETLILDDLPFKKPAVTRGRGEYDNLIACDEFGRPLRVRPMMAPASNDPAYYDPSTGEIRLDPLKKPGHQGGPCYAC